MVRLTPAQALRCEKLATNLWPEERLSVGEISPRLLLEHLLWAESQRNLVERVWVSPQAVKARQRGLSTNLSKTQMEPGPAPLRASYPGSSLRLECG